MIEVTPKILPEELVVKSALPALRASIAKKLISEYGFTQIKVAELLGVTQTAISYYLGNKRGSRAQDSVQDETVKKTISEIARMLSQKEVDRRAVSTKFSDALRYIRKNHLLCNVHKEYEPQLDSDACNVCDIT